MTRWLSFAKDSRHRLDNGSSRVYGIMMATGYWPAGKVAIEDCRGDVAVRRTRRVR